MTRPRPLRLTPESARHIRDEIERAGGREVCFLAEVSPDREIVSPRAVARGNHSAVLAAAKDAGTGEIMVHNHPSGSVEPSDADLTVASRLYELGVGTAIVDNRAGSLYVVVEPPAPRIRVPLDRDRLNGLLAPSGALEQRFAEYEDRPGQRRVMDTVMTSYEEGGISVIEAGTGTGKSLAYLIPAAAWNIANEERTVISTATINLQEQLVGKDLPLVRDLLGDRVRWALVKGRGNYVSIRRARLARKSAADLFAESRTEEVGRVVEWTERTEDGSLADLPFVPSDEVWEEVRSDGDACLRARCPHFQACFYQKARRESAGAPLLVVNHHLLFADLAVRRATGNFKDSAVLPAYRHLVLDEAHNVEDAATKHLGVEVTRRGLFRVLSRLERRGRGVLPALVKELGVADDSEPIRARIRERVLPRLDEARDRLSVFMDEAEAILPQSVSEATRLGADPIGEPLQRVPFLDALDGLLGAFRSVSTELHRVRERIAADEELSQRVEGRLLDLAGTERRLAAAREALARVFDPEIAGTSSVRWMERRGRAPHRNLVFAAAPIEPGDILRESLFTKSDGVSLLSATLTTRGHFEFIRARLGLDEQSGADRDDEPEVVREQRVPSPFDYGAQTMLGVPNDLPQPGSGDAFHDAMARAIVAMAEHSDGGLFALFTSHRSLTRVAERLRRKGAGKRWPLLVQGEAHRTTLLGDFRRSGRAILLGTASFWEGVDVPGRPLRGIVLEKLPFRVPTEPVTAARVEALERRGTDAFGGYMLPLAALRLKQGFGRLIRRKSDRGAVVLLDARILTRKYGRYLLDSLPPADLVRGPWRLVDQALERFYGSSD